MSEIQIFAFLGHLIGDYLLQSKFMALEKSTKGTAGFWVCTAHVSVYTASVCFMVSLVHQINIWFIIAVFVPHWIIDRYSLASWWLKFIRGRTFEKAFSSTDTYREFDIAFTAIVYTVVDNTFHILSNTGSIYLLL